MQAVVNGQADELRQLLSQDPTLATARSQREHGATLIHYLGANGVEKENMKSPAPEICRVLIGSGADADAGASIYSEGMTVLSLVVSSSNPHRAGVQADLVRALIHGGANPNGPANDGAPVKMVICFGYVAAMDALVECGAEIRDLIDAAAAADMDRLEAWVAEDGTVSPEAADIGVGDRHNRFAWPPPAADPKELALVYACRFARRRAVDFLVDRGTDINAAPVNSETGLHWAGFAWQNSILGFLLAEGIDAGHRHADGQTAAELTRETGNAVGADIIEREKVDTSQPLDVGVPLPQQTYTPPNRQIPPAWRCRRARTPSPSAPPAASPSTSAPAG